MPIIPAKRACLHTHCRYCDGHADPADFIREAIASGFFVLGFSSHAPLPQNTSWHMRRDRLADYLAELAALKLEFADDIIILAGLEADFMPGSAALPASLNREAAELDYIIGAVHYLDMGGLFTVDENADSLAAVLRERSISPRSMAEAYYAQLARLIDAGGFDILAHYDLVKKNNRALSLFDENAPWYRSAATSPLDALARSGAMLEVSTGGIARGYTDDLYPSPWLIKECLKRSIPLCLNADAHRLHELSSHYDYALSTLSGLGASHIYTLTGKNKRVRIDI